MALLHLVVLARLLLVDVGFQFIDSFHDNLRPVRVLRLGGSSFPYLGDAIPRRNAGFVKQRELVRGEAVRVELRNAFELVGLDVTPESVLVVVQNRVHALERIVHALVINDQTLRSMQVYSTLD